jgi:hypothetical protein
MTDNLPRPGVEYQGQTAGEIMDQFGINNEVEEPLAKNNHD